MRAASDWSIVPDGARDNQQEGCCPQAAPGKQGHPWGRRLCATPKVPPVEWPSHASSTPVSLIPATPAVTEEQPGSLVE